MRMHRVILFLVLSVVFVALPACGGGGGGGGDSVTPPGTNLIGTYRLMGFDVDYYDYDTSAYLLSIDEGDVSSFSGEWLISSNTMSQTINVEGQILSISDNYSITYTSGTTEGLFHVTAYDIAFSCSGSQITTFVFNVCSSILGVCWDEWDYWEKVSDSLSVSIESLSSQPDSEYQFGELLGSILLR